MQIVRVVHASRPLAQPAVGWRDRRNRVIIDASPIVRPSSDRLVHPNEAPSIAVTQADASIATSPLSRVALASLIALAAVSLAFVFVAPSIPDGHGLPPGAVLAFVKIAVLVLLFKRVLAHHVYSLQWSSMLILLFLAEGTVRATSDPQPLAALGYVEAIAATLYFVAVLGILRPLKQQARRTPPPR